MNGETRTTDAVIPTDKEAIKKAIAAMREQRELHDLYKKHDKGVKANGIDDDETDVTYIDFYTVLCHGCGMPVREENDEQLVEVTDESMNSLLESSRKYKAPIAYIISEQDRIANWKHKPTATEYTAHLTVDAMMYKYREYLDHAEVPKQLIQILNGVTYRAERQWGGGPGDQSLERSHTLEDLVRYDEHFLGKVTPDTLSRLLKIANSNIDPTRYTTRNEAASLYIACAIKHKIPMTRKEVSVMMKRSKNLRLKHELTAKTGKFRMAAVRAIGFEEAIASYHYVKKYKPELLQDPKWVAKKFRFDKNENRLVAFRYFIDYGLCWDNLERYDEFMYAVAKFIPTKHASCADKVKAWTLEMQRKDCSEYRYVFGNDANRRLEYQIDNEYHLMNLCTNIEMFYKHLLNEDIRNQTEDPVADLLGLPDKEAV